MTVRFLTRLPYRLEQYRRLDSPKGYMILCSWIPSQYRSIEDNNLKSICPVAIIRNCLLVSDADRDWMFWACDWASLGGLITWPRIPLTLLCDIWSYLLTSKDRPWHYLFPCHKIGWSSTMNGSVHESDDLHRHEVMVNRRALIVVVTTAARCHLSCKGLFLSHRYQYHTDSYLKPWLGSTRCMLKSILFPL